MPEISAKNYREVIRTIRKCGFIFRRARGSHEIWWNESTKKTCVVPHHREVKAGIIRSIAKQAGIPLERFI